MARFDLDAGLSKAWLARPGVGGGGRVFPQV